ncbi:MAG: hypothetical protein Nk1A_7530 [Endomicrobiia bacterium]|nr:MAG: hypothetical protein Nk1A_7530 [Endomicrobiia bacterium]
MKKSLIALALVFVLGIGSVGSAYAYDIPLNDFFRGNPFPSNSFVHGAYREGQMFGIMLGVVGTTTAFVVGKVVPKVISKVKEVVGPYLSSQPESKGEIAFHLTGFAITCILAPYYALHAFGAGD